MTLAVLCPGQGAQHAAMLDLALADSEGRRVLDAVDAALDEDMQRWTATDTMFANVHAQPLICAAQNAQWRALRERLPPPLAIAGYSVGELSSYGLADAIDPASLARLARERATVMDAAAREQPGSLLGVRGLSRRRVESVCAETGAHLAIAAGDNAFVVGAASAALAATATRCERQGAQLRPLQVGVAAHTPLLAAAVTPLREALEASPLRAPAVAVIAGIDATAVFTRERAIATLAPQIAQTVEWTQCQDALYERGCRVFLELTPGSALSRMVRERFDDVEARAADEFRSVAAIAAWVTRACG